MHLITHPSNYDRDISMMIVLTDRESAGVFWEVYRASKNSSTVGRMDASGSGGGGIPVWMRTMTRDGLMRLFEGWEMEVWQLLRVSLEFFLRFFFLSIRFDSLSRERAWFRFLSIFILFSFSFIRIYTYTY